MKIIKDLIQGSEEWHKHRANHHNASDAPAMLGISPYKTRSELLRECATGTTQEINQHTQKLFDDGHRFEALARTLAEGIIGESLYPITGVRGKLSASFDGVTLGGDIIFEHKTLNEKLRSVKHAQDLPDYIRAQIDQQLIVSDAEKCFFMASKWDDNDELIEEVNFYYYPKPGYVERITKGWEQFEKDLSGYEHVTIEQPAIADAQMQLPAVSIRVNGEIALIDNLDVFSEALKLYIENINTKPETDQDFANLEDAAKTLKKAEDALISSESAALAQAESIDTMRRKVAFNHDLARSNRLLIEKLVKSEKENRRNAILQAARLKLDDHISKLNERLGKPYMPVPKADFAGAMKGRKTITSLQDAADTELARAKIEANEIADRIEINLKTLKSDSVGYEFLFADSASLITKNNEDLRAVISMRIIEHKELEAKKLEDIKKDNKEMLERDNADKVEKEEVTEAIKVIENEFERWLNAPESNREVERMATIKVYGSRLTIENLVSIITAAYSTEVYEDTDTGTINIKCI